MLGSWLPAVFIPFEVQDLSLGSLLSTMSNSGFLSINYYYPSAGAAAAAAANPNPNNYSDHHHQYCFTESTMDPSAIAAASAAEFELSDYLMLDRDGFGQDDSSSQSMVSSEQVIASGGATSRITTTNIKCRTSGDKKKKVENRIAFRTKSELEIMDDGFKWRKYGKKSVKNSPNPRNYYKCSSEGCNVKKRVERDRDDSRYVITTYEGVHTHESPCMVYYNEQQVSLMMNNNNSDNNNGWSSSSFATTLQASSPHSSTSS